MKIDFHASKVNYTEALDGEIVQVDFEEEENDDPLNPTKAYLHISASYEFGSRVPVAQWFDGSDEEGGVEVECFKVTQNEAEIHLANTRIFRISYEAVPPVINKIRSFLSRDCREINA